MTMPLKLFSKSSPAAACVRCDGNRGRRPTRRWLGMAAGLGAAACLLSTPCHAQQPPLHGADNAAAQVFNNACRTCHTVRQGDNRLGPNLYRIVGRRAGALPSYNYSSAMKDAGFVWDEDKLARFIARPDDVVPGNAMKPYSGLASEADTARIVAVLLAARASRP